MSCVRRKYLIAAKWLAMAVARRSRADAQLVSAINQSSLNARSSHSGSTKRKAMPPGFLQDYMLAQQRMKSVGLYRSNAQESTHSSAPEASTSSEPSSSYASAGYVPVYTLPHLFAQRKQFLQQRKQFQPHCDVYRQHPDRPSGLLSLPEDVMVRIE